MTHENYTKFKFQCPQIKFYWNTASSIHLCIILWVFSGRPEPENWKYLLSGPLWRMFADPWARKFLEIFFSKVYFFIPFHRWMIWENETLMNVLNVIEPKEKQTSHPHEVRFPSNPPTMHWPSEDTPHRRTVEMPIKKNWFWSVTSCPRRYTISWQDMI